MAHRVKARKLWTVDRNWIEAEREYRKAKDLDPSSQVNYGFLEWMGLREERLAQLEREAEQADPLSFIQQNSLGWGFLWNREYDRAIEQAKRAIALEPESADPYAIISISYKLMGMEREAFENFLETLRRDGATDAELLELKEAFRESGIGSMIQYNLGRRLTQPNLRPIAIAVGYSGLEDWDKAFEWLEKSWNEPLEGNENAPSNPQFDSIRDDPRFEQLLRKQNLPEEAIQRHLALR